MRTDQQPPVLPSVRRDLRWTVHQQAGRIWYSVLDPASGRWLRLGAREYAIACRMSKELTAADLAKRLLEENAFSGSQSRAAVTEAEITQIAQWLIRSHLVDTPGNKNPGNQKAAWSINPFYMRIPLIPGYRLESMLRPVVPWIGQYWILAAMVAWLLAIMLVISNWSLFATTTSQLFVADGPLWWLIAWLVLKAAHECAHAAVAMKVKTDIRSAGISIIFLAPVPYVDVSDLWSIPNRWNRIACSGAGIFIELTLASLAVFVATATQDESLRYFCCALVTMGTISTLAFNANPLMRFDGYFILSDLLNQPNLWTQASQASKLLLQKLLHPGQTRDQSWPYWGLALYGFACNCYRVSMLLTVAATAILVWEGLGMILVLWGCYAMVIQPWIKQRQLKAGTNKMPNSKSPYQWVSTACIGAAMVVILIVLPSPVQPSAPGVVNYLRPTMLHSEAEGTLEKVSASVGCYVPAGEVLAVLCNPELQLDLEQMQLDVRHAQEAVRLQTARGSLAMVQSETALLDSRLTQLAQLKTKVDRLVVRAPHAGFVVALPVENEIGKRIEVGEALCMLAPSRELEVSVSATQKDAKTLRALIGKPTAVRIAGGEKVVGVLENVDPKGSDTLSEPLLAANYSGPIQVELSSDSSDSAEFRLSSPRFQVQVRLIDPHQVVPGQMAWIPIPGQRMSLLAAIHHWFDNRWKSLQASRQEGT